MNETLLQYFQWYTRADGFTYTRLKKAAPHLETLGVTMVWMPPAAKGREGKKDVGYGLYDPYDLGEFNQKGSVRTKYGNVRQYQAAIKALSDRHIQVIADIILNHRMGGDELESVRVTPMSESDRNHPVAAPFTTDLYSRYTYPGRKGMYSDFIWNSSCFKASDRFLDHERWILLFDGHHWSEHVSKESGNFDYIMGMDIDHSVPWVKDELYRWGVWYTNRFGINGFRFDAVKSIDSTFFDGWLSHVRQNTQAGAFAVGECWSGNLGELEGFIRDAKHCMKLFDVPLHYHLFDCSRSGGNYDVRTLFHGTLSEKHPDYAVAFVDNHDTQPGQALESWIMDWFKTAAYALILLYRCQVPCVFLGDLEGVRKTKSPKVALLEQMMWIRSHLLDGPIVDLFDEDAQKACWIARSSHPVLVLFTIGDGKQKTVLFPEYAGLTFEDISRKDHTVQIDQNGHAVFDCTPGCCSIYILQSDIAWMKKDLKLK